MIDHDDLDELDDLAAERAREERWAALTPDEQDAARLEEVEAEVVEEAVEEALWRAHFARRRERLIEILRAEIALR